MEQKRCTKCGVEKPATSEYFHRSSATADGMRSQCKICRCEYDQQYYRKNKEIKNEYMQQWRKEHPKYSREWRKDNPGKKRQSDQHYRRKFPERRIAGLKVKNAIKTEQLPPAADCFCFICGISADQGAWMEYHHVMYDRPIDVFPLCKSCHTAWHQSNAQFT